jgi:hypothetical protein
MTGIAAAEQHHEASMCSRILAASARSGKREFTSWAPLELSPR